MAEVDRKVGISLILKDKMSGPLKKATSKTKELVEKAKQTNISFKQLGGSVALVGAAVAGAAIAAFKFTESVAKAGDEMFFMSQKTGVSVEELSQFKFVAEQSGTEIHKFQDALRVVSQKAVMGDKNLEKFGLTLKDTEGKTKSAKQLFMESADIISKQTTSTEKAAAAQLLLGRAGMDLIPVFENGSAGMQALSDKADNLGITMSSTGAALSNEFNNQLGSVESMLSGVTRTVGEAMMPAFIRAFNVMQDELKVFAPLAEAVFNGLKVGASLAVQAVSILAQTFVAVGGTITIAWEALLLGFNTIMAGLLGTINAGIRGLNLLLPASKELPEVTNDFTLAMVNNQEAMEDTAKATGEQIIAIQNMENALLNTDPLVIKTATSQQKVADATKETTKSLKELEAIEAARATRKADAEASVEALAAEQAEYRLQMQIKMTNELATAEENAAEQRRNAAEEMENMMVSVADKSSSAFMTAFNAAEEGQNKVGEGMKAVGATMIDTALEVMQTEVMASAAAAAAGAAKSQAGIPIIGPALAAAAAAAMFGLVRGFIAMGFSGKKDGGFITGGTAGKDSVPIMAMPGEYVLTTNQVKQLQQGGSFAFATGGGSSGASGPTNINVVMDTTIPASKSELKKFVRQNIVPALKELKGQGMF